MRLKISDFGEAYKKLDKESSRYCCARYAPPEIWEYFGKLSEDGEDPGNLSNFLFCCHFISFNNIIFIPWIDYNNYSNSMVEQIKAYFAKGNNSQIHHTTTR